ncbi:hypothetical protein MA16_Dca000837 [Dendrobium catenatum]|uniref:Uncharacterized protein n=1 Tax=Dendrobium catenatum TaxID=906689 RepID=A0A2I0WV20_9ASPA|nr:hypothetical protein MA16_Dca000837 [Dendrobium catenatum]
MRKFLHKKFDRAVETILGIYHMPLIFRDGEKRWERYFSLCERVKEVRLHIFFVNVNEPSILGAKAAKIGDVTIKGGEASMASDTDLFFFDCKVMKMSVLEASPASLGSGSHGEGQH